MKKYVVRNTSLDQECPGSYCMTWANPPVCHGSNKPCGQAPTPTPRPTPTPIPTLYSYSYSSRQTADSRQQTAEPK